MVFKPTMEYRIDGKVVVKGNVDAELVLHAMIHFSTYDKAIIVSGDGDFHCLIEYLEQHSKLLRLMTPNSKYSGLLRKFNSFVVRIDQLRSNFEIKKTKISGRSKP